VGWGFGLRGAGRPQRVGLKKKRDGAGGFQEGGGQLSDQGSFVSNEKWGKLSTSGERAIVNQKWLRKANESNFKHETTKGGMTPPG